LTGWTIDSGPKNSWRVEDGSLVVTGPGDWRRSGFILSDREVSDFTLRFEFQPSPNANSGVTFKAMPDEFVGRLAHPLQIELLDRDHPDIKNGSFIWSTSLRPSDMLPPDRSVELLPSGSWSWAEVEVQGDLLRVTINGNRIVTTDLNRLALQPDANPALKRRSGRIGFQSHTGTVRFRNIELKELPAAADSARIHAGKPLSAVTSSNAKGASGQRYRKVEPSTRDAKASTNGDRGSDIIDRASLAKSEWTGFVKQYLNGEKDSDGDVRMVFTSVDDKDFIAKYWVHDGRASAELRGVVDSRGKVKVEKVLGVHGDWTRDFLGNLKMDGEFKNNNLTLRFWNRVSRYTGTISVTRNGGAGGSG
jgi:hypothetical protein